MDPVRAEKIAARRRYLWIHHFHTLFRCLEALAALLLLLLSWSSARLPAAARLSAGLLRRLAALVLGPCFVFLLGNAIVLILFAMSGRHRGSAAPSARDGDIYDKFLACQSRVIQSRPMPPPETAKEEVVVRGENAAHVCRRSQSKRMERRPRPRQRMPELRRSKSELSSKEKAAAAVEKEEEEEREADAEEFRRTIEAFIAEQLRRFHREESMAGIVSSTGTPEPADANISCS